MCVLVMKNNKYSKPLCAKYRTFVIGNFKYRLHQKSQRYTAVLRYISLRLLTDKPVGDKRILQQGDCKNAFCNAALPYDEFTVIINPTGNPSFQDN